MRAIAAHFRYISKNGRLEIEDDRGEILRGAHAVRDLADDWRFGGGLIPEEAEVGGRREAFNIMLSMPRGTDPLAAIQSNLYSLLQTCRVNGIDGYRYLRALFAALPNARTVDDYTALLPWNIDLSNA